MNSQEAARLAFGNPGFFDFLAPLAKPFKSVAPVLSLAAGFIPGVGPLVSKAIDYGASAIQDEASPAYGALFPDEDDSEDDSGSDDY